MPEVKGLIQGTPEWHIWRKGKLSASKSSVILGLSIYQTPYELWEEELGLREPKKASAHMQRGLDIEQEARDWLYMKTGLKFEPTCWEHVNPLYISSLDGMSEDGKHIVEIKNNNKEFHEMARSGNIVPMHYAQVQHHIFVCRLDECYYLSWRKDDPILIIVKKDQKFIGDMILDEIEFKRMCDDLVPPPLTDRDYVDMKGNAELYDLAWCYSKYGEQLRELEYKRTEIKEKIKDISGDRNVKGSGFKLTKYASRTIIDYDKLIADHCPNVDVKAYAKPTTYAYRITMES